MSDFKATALQLRGILGEVESRKSRKEYAQLLADCYAILADSRVALLSEYVQDSLTKLSASQRLPDFTRAGFHFLMQVTVAEHGLFSLFFCDFHEERTVRGP